MMIEKYQTLELVDKPPDRKINGVKWFFVTKFNGDGSISKYNETLVVKGYAHIFGVDYSESFEAAAQLNIFRLLLAITMEKVGKFINLILSWPF